MKTIPSPIYSCLCNGSNHMHIITTKGRQVFDESILTYFLGWHQLAIRGWIGFPVAFDQIYLTYTALRIVRIRFAIDQAIYVWFILWL